MALSQSVGRAARGVQGREGVDLIRESVRLVMQDLIEVDVARAARRQLLGVDRYPPHAAERVAVEAECDADRDAELAIPKLRQGSFFHVILERRRRIDQALVRW